MKVTKCKFNHFYDAEKYASCPHCSQEAPSASIPGKISKSLKRKRGIITENSAEIHQDNNNFPQGKDEQTAGIFPNMGGRNTQNEPAGNQDYGRPQDEVTQQLDMDQIMGSQQMPEDEPAEIQNDQQPVNEQFDNNQYADNQYADNQYADQQYADQQYADQQYADQQYADQQYADQQYADQQYADQQYADQQYADQQYNTNYAEEPAQEDAEQQQAPGNYPVREVDELPHTEGLFDDFNPAARQPEPIDQEPVQEEEVQQPWVPEQEEEPIAPPAPQPQPQPVEPAVKSGSLRSAVENSRAADPFEQTRTISLYSDTGADLVVGWLVSLNGEYKGTGFPLKDGYNNIGRSITMDVALVKELTVSRDKHAILTFEPRKKEFFLQTGSGNNLIYINDEVLMVPTKLNDQDIIQLGNCKFLFKALCGPQFSWDDYR